MFNPPFKAYPFFIRLILMLGLLFVNIGVATMACYLVLPALFGIKDLTALSTGNITNDTERYAFLAMQGIVSLWGFLGTAYLFSYLEARNIPARLNTTTRPALKVLALAIFSILIAQLFIELLVNINKAIPLPQQLQQAFESMQAQEEHLMESMLRFTGIGSFLITAVVIAVIPAIAEEFFFRALLMGGMLRARWNPVVAMFVSGFLFALAHAQFTNMLAIWLMGAFLGYLYYISGSIWLSVVVHLINNFLTVLFKYLYATGRVGSDFAEASPPVWLSLVALVVFTLCVFLFYKWRQKAEFAAETEPFTVNENHLQ